MNKLRLDRNLIIFDLETSGIDVETSSVIQIGACKFHKSGDLSSKETFNIYIKPYASGWNKEAEGIHGLSLDFLEENGVSLRRALKRFVGWIDSNNSNFYFAHWGATFDMNMIMNAFATASHNFKFSHRSYDIASITRFYLAMNGYKPEALFRSAKKLKVNIDKFNVHDALDDAVVAGKCLEAVGGNILGQKYNKFK